MCLKCYGTETDSQVALRSPAEPPQQPWCCAAAGCSLWACSELTSAWTRDKVALCCFFEPQNWRDWNAEVFLLLSGGRDLKTVRLLEFRGLPLKADQQDVLSPQSAAISPQQTLATGCSLPSSEAAAQRVTRAPREPPAQPLLEEHPCPPIGTGCGCVAACWQGARR